MYIRTIFATAILWISLTLTGFTQTSAPSTADTMNYPYWREMMMDPGENFYHVQRAFNLYYKDKDLSKVKGWKPYKRWEYRMLEGKINPDGTRRPQDFLIREYSNYIASHPGTRSQEGTWTNLGPFQITNGRGYKGLGRLNAIAFDPVDPNVVWVGSPSGGLWKTTTNGNNWVCKTENLPSLGVSSILIDHNNPSVMYIGTGDRDAGDANGIGVYRSTDGGDSWEAWNSGISDHTVGRLLMNPTNSMIIFAATNGGLYRSANGGGTWSRIENGDFKDVVFKPNDPNTVYAAAGGNFYRSTNGGLSFAQVTSGLPSASRSAIAVTPDNPSYVFVILTTGDSFLGFYRSTDSGLNFSERSTSPNIMSWGCTGGDGGQAWYDLDVACDPTNSDIIFAGGVNCFKSQSGGTTWNISSHWWGDCGVPSVHADLHVLEYNPLNNRLYAGNDGGVYYTADQGVTWNEITNGLPISQVYKIGQSATQRNKTVNGYQDNGSSTFMGEYWQFVLGGDGMECAVDPLDADYSYATVYNGYIERFYQNVSNGTVANNGFNGIDESGAWITPFILDEKNPNIMFVGYKNIWRTANVKSPSSQIIWQKISNSLGGINDQDMRVLEQSPVNLDILYAARYDNKLFRSDDCKATSPTWTDITNRLPGTGGINDLECDPYNADIVYLSQNNKIYKSTDRGINWENISGTLPDIAYSSIAAYKNSHDGLYVSCDIGVFYKDAFMDDWVMFSDGLPVDASVTEIEIYYDAMDPAGDILRAGTYGRGLWESDVYHASPTADFTADETLVSPGCPVNFTDLSSGIPTAWHWEFTGASPLVSIERNPSGIIYETAGTFPVKLLISNESGADSVVYESYITVDDTIHPIVDFVADKTSICTNGIVHFTDLTQFCPSTWLWDINPNSVDFKEGTDEFSQNPIVEFRQSGLYEVSLTVTNGNGESTLTRTDYIRAGGFNLPFVEDFETGSLSDREWTVENPDYSNTWDEYYIEQTGNHTARMKFYGYYKMTARDRLISPYLNFSELTNVYLTFDHAYAQRFSQKDSLIIYVASGCDGDWTRVWANGPDGNGIFETAPSTAYEFIPLSNDDWCSMGWGADCFTIDLSQWAGAKSVRIAFESYNSLGNDLYLDNITVSNTTGSTAIIPPSGTFAIFPNPGNGLFTLNAEGFTGQLKLEIFNIQGQIIHKEDFADNDAVFRRIIDLREFPKGPYLVRLVSNDKVQLEQLILQ
jgi:PKD repeat protein